MFVRLFAQKPLLLSPENTLKDAIHWSNQFFLNFVPILKNDFLVGYLDLKSVQNENLNAETIISECLPYTVSPLFVYHDEHIYDALLKFQYQDVLVVLNTQGEYEGIISIHQLPDILKYLQIQNFAGGTLVLSIGHKDYSLSEIARIAESCDSKIVSLFLSKNPNDDYSWYLNLKFNTEDLSRIVAAYERFGYEIAYVHQKQLSLSETQNNYESLMKFLEI